jgi:cytochrome P450
MSQIAEVFVERPDHVPPELVVQFNFYSEARDRDLQLETAMHLHAGPDIQWTPQNGGHWIFTRAEDIEYAQRDSDLFSMREVTLPAGATPQPVIPLESDEPEHAQYRAVLQPAFTPAKIMGLEQGVRRLAQELIDNFKPKGRCEFVGDFASHLPIVIFMRLANLPAQSRERLLAIANTAVRPPSLEDRIQAYVDMAAYIDGLMEERCGSDADDIVSMVMRGRMADREMTYAEKHSMILNALFGGLDTVASAMGFVARFLATSPLHRRQLVDDPSLVPRAVEEILRRHGVSNTARVIMRDFDRKGLHFKAGDRVLVAPMLYGLDDRRFPDAARVDFKRKDMRHATFGNGPHRCMGALLARTELKIFVEEWLRRIPDFSLDPDDKPRVEGGMVNSVVYLPLVWAV